MALPLRLESYLAAAEEWAEEQGAVSLEERFRGMRGRASLAVVPLSILKPQEIVEFGEDFAKDRVSHSQQHGLGQSLKGNF